MSSAPAYSCVVDNTPLFRWQCHIFITTLIHNCGVSPADIHIHAIDPEPFFLEHLGNLGVHVVRAARWGDGKYCNKLTQFDTPALRNAGHVILCDCDLAFSAPPTGPAVPGWISGKPVDLPNPDLETLEAIFEASGVPFPETVDTYRGKTFATNCNGGLYGIPGEHFDRLGERWRAHAARLLHDSDILERLGERRIHVDQIAFALAVSELSLPFAPLSTADNCPTHLTALVPQVADALDGQAPRALHFHDRLDPCGFLLPRGTPLIDEAVGRVNTALAAHFSNRLFWDYRYDRHSALGSGIGSRAEMKRKKRLMLKLAGFESAASVLDVGCGDGEVVKGLASGAYTGIDMSAEALDLHRDNNPAASLLLSADRDKAPSAELVLCLDVLIHQDTPEGYRDLIDFVAGKTVRRLIISGYDRREDLDASAMCNFFEGLPESLERTKLFSRIFRIARYRNLSVYVAEKDAGHGGTGTANDMADEMVGCLLAGHTAKDAFLACLLASRSVFGWHTKQYSRAFEYPWLLRQFGEELDGLRVAEFGAGLSPLPLLLSMRGAAVTTLDHGAEVPFAEIRGRNEWGYLDYAAIDDAILSINGPLTGDNVPEGGFDAWYSISVIEHMPRNDRLATLRHMHDSLRPGGRLFLTLDLYKDRTDLWNYCSGEVVEDIERHGDLSAFIQELQTMGFTDVEHLIHRMPPSERIDIAYVSATRPAAEEKTETEPAETNLDIGGQNNRDD